MSDIPEICVNCGRNRTITGKDGLGRTVEMEACGYKSVIREMANKDWQFGEELKTRCGFRVER